MPLLENASQEILDQSKELFDMIENQMGFVPNSMKIMARRPELLQAFAGLSFHVMVGGVLDPALRPLISWAASAAYGCQYCEAHTVFAASNTGTSPQKLQALPEFETNPLFSDKERAAMVFAQCMSIGAGQAGKPEKTALQAHFSEAEIFDIIVQVSFFGFLNRWNGTLETTIEDKPANVARSHLPNWNADKHQA